MTISTYRILGLPVAATDYRGAFECCSRWAREDRGPRLVEAANTHVLALARHDREFGEVMGRFDLLLPDGMPLVWVLNRRHRAGLGDRVYGPTFMDRALAWSQEAEHAHVRHFLLGSTPEILTALETRLRERHPRAVVAGSHSPPFGEWTERDHERMMTAVSASGANFVWTCFGCPKQERWLAAMKDRLPAAIYFGIGAAFAFHAGMVRQAPSWVQRAGMEWCFRMAMEPRRLCRRYLVHNSRFLWYLARDGGGSRGGDVS